MVAFLPYRARSCDGMGTRCCARCCSLPLQGKREHAAASIHEQKRQSPFTSRAKGETFRGTTLVRQASRRRRTRHPDHHQGHAITGGPGSGSQATFGLTCCERLAPGGLSSLSAGCGLLLLICAVCCIRCDCSTACPDCQTSGARSLGIVGCHRRWQRLCDDVARRRQADQDGADYLVARCAG